MEVDKIHYYHKYRERYYIQKYVRVVFLWMLIIMSGVFLSSTHQSREIFAILTHYHLINRHGSPIAPKEAVELSQRIEAAHKEFF